MMGGMPRPACHYQIAFRHLGLNGELNIGECRTDIDDPLPLAFRSPMISMHHKVRNKEFINEREVAPFHTSS